MSTDNNVENCNAENSADSLPRCRRRSSFFERRSLVPEPSMNINVDNTEDGEDDEYFLQYYEKLLSEKSQWKKEVQNRRGILHDAELQLKMAKKSGKIHINYGILSSEDIEFLQEKPNLKELFDRIKKLQQSTLETLAFYKRMTDVHGVLVTYLEKMVKRHTTFLLENSSGQV